MQRALEVILTAAWVRVRVRVRVSRGHGYHVLYVPTLFFDLFLPVAYTSSDSKVYGSFRFFKQIVLHT